MLEGYHFQNGYIVDDIEATIKSFAKRAGIPEVSFYPVTQEVSTPEGPKQVSIKVAFLWVDDLQYELIEIVDDQTGIYAKSFENGGELRFHHICNRVEDWDAFRARVAAQDLPVVMERAIEGDGLKFLYIDARPWLGHYLEYVWMSDDRWAALGPKKAA